MQQPEYISIIVTTYNRPDALQCVLQGFAQQSCKNFEVLVADDGSTPETAQMIKEFSIQASFPLKHIWQEDQGFRAAMIRNKAAAQAQGNYLIFIDGDCIPLPDFIIRHQQLAEYGWFVAGNRVLLNESFTQDVLLNHLPLYQWSFQQWLKARITGQCNRLAPIISLPLGLLRKLKKHQWQGVKTCNLALWKNDFMSINGFDESYTGWGYEDSDLVIRLLRNGIKRKEGRFATAVIHLWHNENDRSQEQENLAKLNQILQSDNVRANKGVAQYIYP